MENEKLIRIEESNKNTIKRLDNMEKKIEDVCEITISVKEITMEIKQMRQEVNEIEKRIAIIEEKPRKRWDDMVTQIISLVVAGVFGYFLSKFGM